MQKRDQVVLAALVIGLLVGAATYALTGSRSRTSTSTTVTTTHTTSTATSHLSSGNVSSSGYGSSGVSGSNGLRLTLTFLSLGTFSQGGSVRVSVSLTNTLPTRSNLTASDPGFGLSLGPCSQLPLGVAIFKGNIPPGNLSQHTPLDIFYPGAYNCPSMLPVAYWSFAPESDNVTLVGPGPANASNTENTQTAANLEYWGYWSGPGGVYPFLNASFASFQPGIYALEAKDAWGQMAVLYFEVDSNQNPLDCATIASNLSFKAQTNDSVGSGPLKLDAYYQEQGSNDTFVLALTAAGDSNETLTFFSYATTWFLDFNPDPGQVQSWQYFAPNGTLAYPATFYPNECSLLRVVIPQNSTEIPLRLDFSDNQTQTLTLNP